ncbi:WD repeat-containing protein 24 [Cladochytrium tenue]|nr:WD repeat-containing protein 24 [Cladochytrium tenue]
MVDTNRPTTASAVGGAGLGGRTLVHRMNGPLTAVSASPDGIFAVVGGRDVLSVLSVNEQVREWFNLRAGARNLNSGLTDVKWGSSPGSVRDVQFNPLPQNSYEFIAAFDNGDIQPIEAQRRWSAHYSLALTVDWHSDGRYFASAGRDKVIKIWDSMAESRKPDMQIQTMSQIARIAWRPGANGSQSQIASCSLSGDRRVMVWDLARPFVPEYAIEEHTDQLTAHSTSSSDGEADLEGDDDDERYPARMTLGRLKAALMRASQIGGLMGAGRRESLISASSTNRGRADSDSQSFFTLQGDQPSFGELPQLPQHELDSPTGFSEDFDEEFDGHGAGADLDSDDDDDSETGGVTAAGSGAGLALNGLPRHLRSRMASVHKSATPGYARAAGLAPLTSSGGARLGVTGSVATGGGGDYAGEAGLSGDRDSDAEDGSGSGGGADDFSTPALDVTSVCRAVIDFFAERGAVQMCATVALVLASRVTLPEEMQELWVWNYSDFVLYLSRRRI